MTRPLAVVVWATLLGASGCVGPAPALPPETGFADSTTTDSTTTDSTTTDSTTTDSTTTGIASTGVGSPDGCTSNEQCSGATPVCDPGSGECVACLPGGGHCPPEEYCDPTLLECTVGCDESSDCPRTCDLDAHVCVDCVIDGDCPTGTCEANECVSMGFPCGDDTVCDTEAGEHCCIDPACLDRCMVPCTSAAECPAAEPPMQCEHGYCLFPCRSNADCTTWPGFTCLHMGTLCEL